MGKLINLKKSPPCKFWNLGSTFSSLLDSQEVCEQGVCVSKAKWEGGLSDSCSLKLKLLRDLPCQRAIIIVETLYSMTHLSWRRNCCYLPEAQGRENERREIRRGGGSKLTLIWNFVWLWGNGELEENVTPSSKLAHCLVSWKADGQRGFNLFRQILTQY